MRRVLFLENEDSFTWNVIDRLPVPRADLLVVRGRAAGARDLDGVDAMVVGPGPEDPVRAGLVGVVRAAVDRGLPVLGVCLGHQAIGLAFGARVVRAAPVHGKRSTATFERSRMFPRFTGPEVVMRYHSLALDDVRAPLRVIATADGLPMAIEHEVLPVAGVQFHPVSYATPRGEEMLASFFEVAWSS